MTRPRPAIHSISVVASKPTPRRAIHSISVVASKPTPRRAIHSVPVVASKPAPPRLNLPPTSLNPPPPPAPLVTLGGGEDAKAQAQRLVDQAAGRIAHIDQAQLAGDAAFAYQQASALIEAAQHAMATQDYPAASSLAEKASALTDHLLAPR